MSTRERELSVAAAMRLARKAATQVMTQSAVVCYGLPVQASK